MDIYYSSALPFPKKYAFKRLVILEPFDGVPVGGEKKSK